MRRFPRDKRLAELICRLNEGNARFAELWANGAVDAPGGSERIEHPAIGPILVDCDTLTDGDSELKIVIMTAAPGSEDETKMHFAEIAGSVQ